MRGRVTRFNPCWQDVHICSRCLQCRGEAPDLTAINGRREELEGKIQERYGIAKDQARKDVDAWFTAQNF